MKPLSNELKVGLLIAGTLVLTAAFAWFLGVRNPFERNFVFSVTYRFAGGLQVGSPVRLSGIKVGKVEKIEFLTPDALEGASIQEPGSALADPELEILPVRVRVSIQKDASPAVKKDSRFYINMAGIIGERYLEITPGTKKAPTLAPGEVVAGVDPPRIDQLLSQSFDLAGKLADIIEKNKGDITKSIDLLTKLSANLNQTLHWVDKSKMFKTDLSRLINNLIDITTDIKRVTDKTGSPEGERTLKLLYDLLWRLEPMNSHAIREFFQKEGLKAKVSFF